MPLDLFVGRAIARVRLRHALRAVAAGLLAASGALLILRVLGAGDRLHWAAAIAVFVFAAAASFLAVRGARGPRLVVATVERADPSLRNLLVTAEQLRTRPGDTKSYILNRVLADAGTRVAGIDLGRALPIGREAAVLAGATLLFALAASVPLPAIARVQRGAAAAGDHGSDSADGSLVLDVRPPDYSGRQPFRLTDPVAIEVLAGSRARLQIPGGSNTVRVNGAAVPLGADGVGETAFTESGYVAVQGRRSRLIPLTVIPDRIPDVRIIAPARDLRVETTAASIPIVAEAHDDLGLGSFELRYTIVSGTGEQFSFTEGVLPASVARASERAWRIEGSLSLARLKLEPGDALIYRAVAADRRPGDSGVASSDTFFVEVAGPGDVPLEGVDMPPDKERYALSQAMIVLKIERLQAREKTLARQALTEAAGTIAAEQRAVRANFIFLLGGEVEDEEAEAEASHEISEGRFANQARREIVAATVLMGRVEKALSAPSTSEALPLAREAVKALQRAFGHSRYLLRALPSRARIDPARRLSGDVSSAADWSRMLAPVLPDPQAETARAALVELVAVNRSIADQGRRDINASILGGVAERLLAGGMSPELQLAARDVLAARDAMSAGRVDAARTALRRAAAPLLTLAQRHGIGGAMVSRDAARLAGAAAMAAGGRR